MGNGSDIQRIEEKIFETSNHYPKKLALQMAGDTSQKKYSYAALKEKTNIWGERLTHFGLLPGDRVIVLSQSIPEAVISLLAIWKCHGTAVVLDPTLPHKDLDALINRVKAKAILVSNAYSEILHHLNIKHLPVFLIEQNLDPEPEFLAKVSQENPTLDPDVDIALILFTSGTSQNFLGVCLTHKGTLYSLEKSGKHVNLGPDDVVLGLLPFFHVYTLAQVILTPLTYGSSIYFVPHLDKEHLMKAFHEVRPTITVMVPRILEIIYTGIQNRIKNKWFPIKWILMALIKLGTFPVVKKKLGGRLRRIVSGGAYLDPLIHNFFENLGITILQGYGLTESCGGVTVNRMDRRKIGSLGLPYEGMEVRIDNPESDGKGEICLKGPPLLKRYFQDDILTQKSFKGEWFYTGDIGHFDKDGFLFFSGRKKDLIVTSGGKKVSPEFIEKYYSDIPLVSEIVVFGLPSQLGSEQDTHAAIVLMENHFSEDEIFQIRKKITAQIHQRSQNLPVIYRINHLHFFKEIPKTTTLKAKRYLLQKSVLMEKGAKPFSSPENKGHVVQNRKFKEQIVVLITKTVEELLPLKTVDRKKDFLSLGADSLTINQMYTKLLEKGYKVNLKDFFEFDTIEKLAGHIAEINKK